MIPLIFLIYIIFFLGYLSFGIYVIIKMPASFNNRMFFSLCLHLSIWSLGYALMCIAPNIVSANLWRCVASVGWCFIYGIWLDFAILVKNNNKKEWMTDIRRLLLYLPSFFFFIDNLRYKPEDVVERLMYGWRDIYPTNIFVALFYVYYICYAIAGIMMISQWGKRSVLNREKKQAYIIIVTTICTLILGTLFEAVFKLADNIYPMNVLIFSIALFGIYHAITKYDMMSFTSPVTNDYILGAINDPVILVGSNLLIKEVNLATIELTGFQEAELIGIPIHKIINHKDIDQEDFLQLILSGSAKNYEIELISKHYYKIPCLFSGGLILNKFKDALGIACIFHNITDRKTAENILRDRQYQLETMVQERTEELQLINQQLLLEIAERKSAEESVRSGEERLRALIMQSSEGIIVLDVEKKEILECTQEARKILSICVEHPQELTEQLIYSPKYYRIGSIFHRLTTEKKKNIKETIKFATDNHMEKNLEISATMAGYLNKQYIIITIRDITTALIMEERKQQIAKMEALGTLSGGIAHDFNNILAGIIGYADLTLEDLRNEPSLAENLNEILKLGDRAKKLISQILTFSKKTLLTYEKTDLRFIAGDVVKMLKTTLPANITIITLLQEQPCLVNADNGEMYQLIMNLCVNAKLAFDNSSGTITVSLLSSMLDKDLIPLFPASESRRFIRLEITDDGCGIDEVVIKRIFEPFYTTRESRNGTGLGLSVVHGIVTRMQGVIYVNSEPGKGSTFRIFLPEVTDIVESNLPDTEPELEVTTLRILLVDDEEAIVTSVQKLLRRSGYFVKGVLSSEEALTLFRDNPDDFDLLVSDQSMPGILGDELIKEFRSIRRNFPAVLCSGYRRELVSDTDLHTIHLQKPIDIKEYIAAINHLLRIKSYEE